MKKKYIPVRQDSACGASSQRSAGEEQRAWRSGTCATLAAVPGECGAYLLPYHELCLGIGILPDAEK